MIFSGLAVYIGLQVRGQQNAGQLGNSWIWLSCFITPFNHVLVAAWLAPQAWRSNLWRNRLLSYLTGLVLAALTCEAGGIYIVLLDAWFLTRAGAKPSNLARLLQLYLFFVGPTMVVLGGLIAARAGAEDEKEAVRQEAQVAKTRLLQSQLHPHVLFNALNGLAELIHKDPPLAEESVRHLADLLRKILRASEFATLRLGEERALVEDYLFLEGLRLGERMTIEWDWDPALNGLQVPPLLLQPLVENAIKHGISPNRTGGRVILRARGQNNNLHLEVWNSGVPYEQGEPGGIGLRNLASRLALVYGPYASFRITPSDGGTLAAIRVAGVLLQ